MNRRTADTANNNGGSRLELKPARSIFVLYQDDSHHAWAEETYAALARQDPGVLLRCTWWKLDDLGEPGVLAGAISTAMRADTIVAALTSQNGYPLPFYVWASAWLPNRRAVGGSMIALLDAETESPEYPREYLRALARRAHMQFLCEERPASALLLPQAVLRCPSLEERALAIPA